MSRRWPEVAGVLGLLVLLGASHAVTNKGALDDVAVLRASAWLQSCGADAELPRTLRAHFEQYAPSLSFMTRERFRLRADFTSNYALIGPMVQFAEASVGLSPLGAVKLACLVQHLLVLAGVLALAWRRQLWLLAALVASALPALRIWPGHVGNFLAFQRDSMTWTTSSPRGAAVLAWFGALLLLALVRDRLRWLWATAGLVGLSFLCHRSMALLCFGSTLPVVGLWLAVRDRITWRPRAASLIASFVALALVVVGLKFALLLLYHSQTLVPLAPSSSERTPGSLRSVAVLLAWGAEVGALLFAWLRARESGPLEFRLRRVGDACAVLLGVTAAVDLGLNAVHPGADLWYGPLFFITEASMRLGTVPQLLFWSLAGITLQAAATGAVGRVTLVLAGLGVLLSGPQLFRAKGAEFPRRVPPLEALLEQGRGAYSNEVAYYLSVGTHVGRRGCGPLLGLGSELEAADEK